MTKKQLLEIFARRCRQAREANGLKQTEVAQYLIGRDGKPGVDRELISQIESGKTMPSGHNLRILAEVYGQSIDWLLANDPAPRRAKRTGLRPLAALLIGALAAGAPAPGKAELYESNIHYAQSRRRARAKGLWNGPDKLPQCLTHPISSLLASMPASASANAAP